MKDQTNLWVEPAIGHQSSGRLGGDKRVGFKPEDIKLGREEQKLGPYRWVWIDGCKSSQKDWPDAFGIATSPKIKYTQTELSKVPNLTEQNNLLNSFKSKGKLPNAYLGWDKNVTQNVALQGKTIKNEYGNYRKDLLGTFIGFNAAGGSIAPETLHTAIKTAAANNTTPGTVIFAVEDGLVLFGFKYLRGRSFNDAAEIDAFLRNGTKPPGY